MFESTFSFIPFWKKKIHFEFQNVQTTTLKSSHYAEAFLFILIHAEFEFRRKSESLHTMCCTIHEKGKKKWGEEMPISPWIAKTVRNDGRVKEKKTEKIICQSIYWISVFNLIWFPFLCCACNNYDERKKKIMRIILSSRRVRRVRKKEKTRPDHLHVCKS